MNFTDNILENNGVYEIGEFNLEEFLPNMSDIFVEDTVVAGANLGGKLTKVKISVYANEGNIPHFHIHSDNKKMMPDGDCCIMICEAKYFEHGNHKGKLNNNQAKNLNMILSSPSKRDKSISIWKAIWNIWHNYVDSNIRKCDQPNYSLLN